MSRFHGKTILITGGASGIGLAAVRRFLTEGGQVASADRTAHPALDGRHLPLELDVADPGAWPQAIAAVESRFGALHVLVNNAGIGHPARIDELSFQDWRQVMAVNLDGVFLGIRHAVPALRRAGGGVIVNVASMLGQVAAPMAAAYCAAKSGVLGLTRAAALDLAADGIRVCALNPGYVETPLLAARLRDDPARADRLNAEIPLGRLAGVDEIAAALAFLASDEAGYVTGSGLLADGGFTAR